MSILERRFSGAACHDLGKKLGIASSQSCLFLLQRRGSLCGPSSVLRIRSRLGLGRLAHIWQRRIYSNFVASGLQKIYLSRDTVFHYTKSVARFANASPLPRDPTLGRHSRGTAFIHTAIAYPAKCLPGDSYFLDRNSMITLRHCSVVLETKKRETYHPYPSLRMSHPAVRSQLPRNALLTSFASPMTIRSTKSIWPQPRRLLRLRPGRATTGLLAGGTKSEKLQSESVSKTENRRKAKWRKNSIRKAWRRRLEV